MAISFTGSTILAEESPPILNEKLSGLIKQGMASVYNLEYDQGLRIFQQIIRDDPDSPVGYTYVSLTLWIKELNAKKGLAMDRFAAPDFFGESKRFQVKVDRDVEREFRQVTQKAIERAKAALDRRKDDPAALFMLGIAYGNLASFESTLKRSWIPAVRNGGKAYDAHKGLLKRNPPVYDVYQTIAVAHYVVASLPFAVRWLAAFLGRHGDKERAKKELQTVVEKGTFFNDDSRILLSLIYTRERNFPKAFGYLEEVHRKYPKNYLAELALGGIAVLMDKLDLAEEIYQRILKKIDAGTPNYHLLSRGSVYNRLSEVYARRKDYASAERTLRKTLSEEKTDNELVSIAHLQLGKIYDLSGNRPEALKEYQIVLRRDDVAGSHEEARRYSRTPYTVTP